MEELAGLGASVHTCARNEAELNACLLDWKTKGLPISGSICDISSRPQREKLMETINSIFNGKLNILVSRPLSTSCNFGIILITFKPQHFPSHMSFIRII